MTRLAVFILLFILLPILGTPAPTAADEVQLANGDRITGELVDLANGTLTFSTPHGALRIPWALVTSLAIDSPVLVTAGRAARAPASSAIGNPSDGLALASGGSLAFADITAITRPEPAVTINGGTSAGVIRSGGNSDVNSLRLDGHLGIRAGANRYTASGTLIRSDDRGAETARNWSTSLKYDRFLSSRLFVNANAILTSDFFRDLDLRTALGAGLGYQVVDTPRVKLTTDAGIGGVNDNLSLQSDNRYTAARESATLDIFLILPDRMQLFHQHDGYFGVTGQDNMFVRTQNGIRVGFAGGFVTTMRLDLDYDRTPAAGRRDVDRTVAITLGYQF